jgi:hypothetical protein
MRFLRRAGYQHGKAIGMSRINRRALAEEWARSYLRHHDTTLAEMPLRVHLLDGPPTGPRYIVSTELCTVQVCPLDVAPAVAQAGECSQLDCQLRHSLRLLLDEEGNVLQATGSGIHWT